MATQKAYIRPYKYYNGSDSVSFYPSNTDGSSIHLLLSEEIADDDATYICDDNVAFH